MIFLIKYNFFRAAVEVKHKGVIIAADWIANGDRFVTASWDNSVKVWVAESGKILHDLETGLYELHK